MICEICNRKLQAGQEVLQIQRMIADGNSEVNGVPIDGNTFRVHLWCLERRPLHDLIDRYKQESLLIDYATEK
jgi:hypothetical protein